MKSILHDKKRRQCFVCMMNGDDSTKDVLQEHHVYTGIRKNAADRAGLMIYLCPECHIYKVHGSGFLVKYIKEVVQIAYEQLYSHEEFMARIGKSYKEEEMNKVILIGRLTRDPEIRYTSEQMAIARYTLAVDRRSHTEGGPTADFIGCVAFGKIGEFAEKYLHKGTKIAVTGRIQTGSYTNKDGQKVYTTEVVIESHEFAESARGGNNPAPEDGFMNIDGIDDEIPFN